MESLVSVRNKLNKAIYLGILRKKYFKQDPEYVHDLFLKRGKSLSSSKIMKSIVSLAFNYSNPRLEQNILGIKFRNPLGLSAGFDKNAEIIPIISEVGFGFAEVGSITAHPGKGNIGTRLKRLPEKKSIWVYLGLNNKGALAVKRDLKDEKFKIPVGISIAKTNCKETTNPAVGLKDYLFSLKELKLTPW